MDTITAPKKDDDVRDLWKSVAACVRSINAIANMDVKPDGDFTLSDSNAVLDLGDSVGGGSGSSGLCVFAGTASGELAYFLVSCDGVAYSAPPAGYPIANPE